MQTLTPTELAQIREIYPDFDDLPNLLNDADAGRMTGFTTSALATFRNTGAHAIPFMKSGKKITYPKMLLAKWCLARMKNVAA